MDGERSEGESAHRDVQPLVVLGGGGHASDVPGLIEFIHSLTPTWQVLGFADDTPEPRLERFEGRGVPYLGTIDDALNAISGAQFIATKS